MPCVQRRENLDLVQVAERLIDGGSVSRGTLKTGQGELPLAEVTKEDISGVNKFEPKQIGVLLVFRK